METGSGAASGPRQRLAAALEEAIKLTMSARFDDDTAARAAQALEALNAQLGKAEVVASPGSFDPEYLAGDFRLLNSPTTGLCNPLAPPVRIRDVEGAAGGPREVLGSVVFDYAYEGVPNCVHGGVIAQTLDEILGAANQAAGTVGMTGTMTVRYRRPTPSRTELRLVARMQRREGRKLFSWAGIYHGEILTAEAEGIFIEVPHGKVVSAAGN